MSPDKHDVFISYSTKNSDVANKICHILEQNNLKCWIAPRNISSGRVYIDEIGEAIKSTKIVVLVYSQFSQESKYVDNEINMAFSNKKSILSFNIDDSEPKESMEYYLKVTQWLPAFPNPEAHFETLVKDVLELCDEKSDVPVIVDFTNYKQEDLEILGYLFLIYPMFTLFALLFILFWAIAIIHGLVIRNEFLTRKSVLRFTYSDDELFDYLYEEYVQL